MSKSDLVIHPTRLRIIQAFGANRRLTAQQLASVLPDIPRASLYRHLNLLVAGDIIEVVEERLVRAIQERVYALKERAANVGPMDYAATASADDHLRYFSTFLDLLRSDFARYLQRPGPHDLHTDGVAYYQMPLYLTEEEYQRLIATLKAILWPVVANRPAPGRQRRLLSIIAMPGEEESFPAGVSPDETDTSATEILRDDVRTE